ncbi:MAG: DUF4038 domain-containing protein [Planctomycetes bacterium]|nr:DUF4038 domain-containing protein [Planctomycetota bacterium]
MRQSFGPLLVMICGAAPLLAAEVSLHVAPRGSDQAAGDAAMPLATPHAATARLAGVAKDSPDADVRVLLHSGVYRIEHPLVIHREQVPSRGSLTFAAVSGERVVISGGRRITGWTVNDDNSWSVSVPAAAEGEWTFRELFVDGQRRPRARHPSLVVLTALLLAWSVTLNAADESTPPNPLTDAEKQAGWTLLFDGQTLTGPNERSATGQSRQPGDITRTNRLAISFSRRYLVDAKGAPFFYLCDTAWDLFMRLDREEADEYLKKRAEQGFNVIMAIRIGWKPGEDEKNAYGEPPLIDKDPARPNDVRLGSRPGSWMIRPRSIG